MTNGIVLTDEILNGELKSYLIRLPEEMHNALKAEAALKGTTKDEHFKNLLVIGHKNQ